MLAETIRNITKAAKPYFKKVLDGSPNNENSNKVRAALALSASVLSFGVVELGLGKVTNLGDIVLVLSPALYAIESVRQVLEVTNKIYEKGQYEWMNKR